MIKYSVHQDFFPEIITSHKLEGNCCTFKTTNNVFLRVEAKTSQMIRFRFATVGYFQDDFSYAISPDFQNEEVTLEIEDKGELYVLKTEDLIIQLFKSGLKTRILNIDGVVICEDEKGFHWEAHPRHGGAIVKMTKQIQEAEHFFGLGDKATEFNLRGKRLKIWGTDEYGFEKNRDPLYKNIPFYIGLHHKIGYGIFFDNSFKSYFDFGSERGHVSSFWAHGGEMNYYFIYGPHLLNVVERYTELTGKPELPPLWALGYHQCKWSYYPERNVREVTEKFRELKLPCDAIYLDIDYMDGFRCFTWNKEHFPEFKKMIDDLKEQGFKTVVMIDPGIKVDENYWVFKEAFEKNYFCKRADGDLMIGKVWPGDCAFPDFTNPKVRHWWAGLYKEFIAELGIQGVWNDMNEPAVFEVESKTFPNDVRHDYDNHPCSHRKTHNVYGMQMARATYDGLKKYTFPNRPFVITRSAYSGAQRYTSAWTGDNVASWEHLWLASVQCQRMAVSGFSFIGSDIGGFIEHPSPELYVRWIQLGIFHPFCRTHSSGDHGDQEPWSFGAASIPIIRKYIELRYQLLPYIYTTFWQYASKGTPMLRPISFVEQENKDTWNRSHEFMLGDNLLICPMFQSGAQGCYAYLTKGQWFDFWSDEMYEGGREIWTEVPLDKIPLFVKAGSVLPFNPVMQYVGEKPVEELTLNVYFKNGEEKSVLYEDRGEGYDYKHGDSNVKYFYVAGDEKKLQIKQEINGDFIPEYEVYQLEIHGLPFDFDHYRVGGKVFSKKEVTFGDKGQLCVKVPARFSEIIVE